MAKWIPQSEVSSITPAARRRTGYLHPLLSDVILIIDNYIKQNPDEEDVTLEVLEQIGQTRLQQVDPGKSLDRIKQDLGLLTAQTLVDMYGAMRVESLRRPDEKAASTRRNRRKKLNWVKTYTPHRILDIESRPPRILLDTCVIRKVIHGDDNAIDLVQLREIKGIHPVSIADAALAELASALLRSKGGISLSEWKERVALFDSVLDSDFPVAPGGMELAALWGLHPMTGLNLAEMQWYHRSIWRHLTEMKDASELEKDKIVSSPWGTRYRLCLDTGRTEETLNQAGEQWTSWVDTVSGVILEYRAKGEELSEEFLIDLTKAQLRLDMAHADIEKLDLVIHVMARRATQAANKRYNPKKPRNDSIDLDLLFGVPLPAIVCTNDDTFVDLIRSTDSPDKDKVMTPEELLSYLKEQ